MKHNNSIAYTFLVFVILLISVSCKKQEAPEKSTGINILIYSKTKAYRHECIESGRAALESYFAKHNISTTITEDSSLFTSEKLKDFDAVMFFNTTGNVLDSVQQIAFEKYIRSGRGFVGVHAASDTEYDWPWYGKLVGAYYTSHPDIQNHVIEKVDTTSHPSCTHLPNRWKRTDECYNFKTLPTNVHVLLTADETTYTGGTHGDFHPMAWYHSFEGGRSFYTALGHTVESYQDTMLLEHIMRGTMWAAKP